MKKTYISPVVEELFAETTEILQTSTLEAFTDSDAPEIATDEVLSRGLIEDVLGDGMLNIFQ